METDLSENLEIISDPLRLCANGDTSRNKIKSSSEDPLIVAKSWNTKTQSNISACTLRGLVRVYTKLGIIKFRKWKEMIYYRIIRDFEFANCCRNLKMYLTSLSSNMIRTNNNHPV